MKRLHIHVSVKDIAESVRFYSAMFGTEPIKHKPDYAKWLLDDPRVNFAISARGIKPGVDHLGIQVEEDSELAEVRERIKKADLATFNEGETTCCYSKADKSWVLDPAGVPWEAYKNMADAETYGADQKTTSEAACCAPVVESPNKTKKTSCC